MKRFYLTLLALAWLCSCNLSPELAAQQTSIAETEEASRLIDVPTKPIEPSPVKQQVKTQLPQSTPEPAVELPFQVTGALDEVNIIFSDNFSVVMDNWYQGSGYLDVKDGVGAVLVTSEGFSYLYPGSAEGECRKYHQGEGIYFKMKLPSKNLYHSIVSFQSASEYQDDYSERGVAFEYNNLNDSYISYLVGWSGAGDGRSNMLPNQKLEGNLSILPDHWYHVMLALNKEGELIVKIWNPDEPGKRLIKQTTFGEGWKDREYEFSIFTMGDNNTMTLDDYVEFDFSPGDILLAAIDYELPLPVKDSLSAVRSLTHQDFEKHPNWYAQSGFLFINNGIARLEMNPGSKTNSAYLVPGPPMRPLQYTAGRAVLLKYMVNHRVDASFTISSGEWETPDYREFGLMSGYNEVLDSQVLETNLWYGNEVLPSDPIGNDDVFTVEADRWYYLLLALDGNGEFLINVWDIEKPEKVRSLHTQMGDDWADRPWQFNISFLSEVPSNAVYLDDYVELSFNDITIEQVE